MPTAYPGLWLVLAVTVAISVLVSLLALVFKRCWQGSRRNKRHILLIQQRAAQADQRMQAATRRVIEQMLDEARRQQN